jgi:hypothetical protein
VRNLWVLRLALLIQHLGTSQDLHPALTAVAMTRIHIAHKTGAVKSGEPEGFKFCVLIDDSFYC